jgi:hypothetical protein
MASEQSKHPSKQVTEARAAAQRAKMNTPVAERRRTAHIVFLVVIYDVPSEASQGFLPFQARPPLV